MFWYEDEIKRLEKERQAAASKAGVLFYGSSSIRLWGTLAEDFKGLNVVNLGFGGSTLAACVWFFDRVMDGYQPDGLVFYAGDNDLGDGRHPEEIFIFFQELAARVTEKFGSLPCYFISLKPSINRWHQADQFRYTNQIIATEINNNHPDWQFIDIFNAMLTPDGQPNPAYYLNDGLHLSDQGYLVWKTIIQNALSIH